MLIMMMMVQGWWLVCLAYLRTSGWSCGGILSSSCRRHRDQLHSCTSHRTRNKLYTHDPHHATSIVTAVHSLFADPPLFRHGNNMPCPQGGCTGAHLSIVLLRAVHTDPFVADKSASTDATFSTGLFISANGRLTVRPMFFFGSAYCKKILSR